jgi:hypothetical protein
MNQRRQRRRPSRGRQKHQPHAQGDTTSPIVSRVELTKHRPITQHIGATYHQYPHDKVGDTLLRQQAVLAINSIPGLIERLHQDISDIRTIRRQTTATPPQPPEDWHNAEEESHPSPTANTRDSNDAADIGDPPERQIDTAQRVRSLERLKTKMAGIQMHFDPGKQSKVGTRDLQLLKSEDLIDASVSILSQREAHAIVSKQIVDIEEEIASLKRQS